MLSTPELENKRLTFHISPVKVGKQPLPSTAFDFTFRLEKPANRLSS
jgi:hypothetical protein